MVQVLVRSNREYASGIAGADRVDTPELASGTAQVSYLARNWRPQGAI